ncbi:MAG: hypothetical protein AAB074_04440 [Planctomycetota bacterium]
MARWTGFLLLALPAFCEPTAIEEALKKARVPDKPVAILVIGSDALAAALEKSLGDDAVKKELGSFLVVKAAESDASVAAWAGGGTGIVVLSSFGREFLRWAASDMGDGNAARVAELLAMARGRYDKARKEVAVACAGFEASLGGQDKEAMLDLAKKVTALKDPRALQALARGMDGKSLKVREHIIQEAHGIDEKLGQEMLAGWLKRNPQAPLAPYAWKFVAAKADASLIPLLKDGIETCAPEYRIPALGRIRERSNIPYLIELLGRNSASSGADSKEKEKIRDECNFALKALTGQANEGAAAWKAWWKGNEKSFKFAE